MNWRLEFGEERDARFDLVKKGSRVEPPKRRLLRVRLSTRTVIEAHFTDRAPFLPEVDEVLRKQAGERNGNEDGPKIGTRRLFLVLSCIKSE